MTSRTYCMASCFIISHQLCGEKPHTFTTSVHSCPTDPHHFDNPVYAYPEKARADPLPLPPNIPVQKNDLGGPTHVKQLAMDDEEGEW